MRVPVGVSIFIINVPLFIIGGKVVGKDFFLNIACNKCNRGFG
jgi:uncharacterized membrane-anchored protein YitT (DUF2179 family)